MDDKKIISLLFDRNEKALEILNEKYGAYCLSIANSILRDTSDSEECVNDTWLSAWNSIPPAKPESLKLYLSKLVRNLSFNKYKKNKAAKRGGTVLELALDEISELQLSSVSIETELERKEFVKMLDRFLSSISDRDRKIFLYRYFLVKSINEISSILRISENNTMTILSRTRAKLKKHLKKEGYAK